MRQTVHTRTSGAILLALLLIPAAIFAVAPDSPSDRDFAFAVGLYKDGLYQMAAVRFSDFTLKYAEATRAPQALYLLGECQFQLEKWDSARDAFKRFLDKFPFDELADKADLRYCQTFLEGARPADAVKALQAFTSSRQSSPLLPEAVYWLGEAQSASKDTSGAESSFRLLLTASPRHSFAPWAGY